MWLQPGDETAKTNVEDVSGRSGVRVETTWGRHTTEVRCNNKHKATTDNNIDRYRDEI